MASLYDDVNRLVEKRVENAHETGELINLPDWVSEMTESLADMIVNGCPPDDRATLIAYAFEQLGYYIRVKTDGEAEPADGDGKLN